MNIPSNLQEIAPPPVVGIHPALGPDSWALGYTFFVLQSDFLKAEAQAGGIYGMCLCRMRGKEFWFEQLGQIIPEGHLVAAKGLLGAGMGNVGLTPALPGEEIELALTEWHVSTPHKLRRTAWAKFVLPNPIRYPEEPNTVLFPNPDKSFDRAPDQPSTVFAIGCTPEAYMADEELIVREIQTLGPQGINGLHVCFEAWWWGSKEWQGERPVSQETLQCLRNLVQTTSRTNFKLHIWLYGKWPMFRSSIPPQSLGSGLERQLMHEIEHIIRGHNHVSLGLGFDTWHDEWGRGHRATDWAVMARQVFGPKRKFGIRNFEHDAPLRPYDEVVGIVTLNEVELPKPNKGQMLNAKEFGLPVHFSDRFEVPGSPEWGRAFTVDELNQTIINCLESGVDCTIGFRPPHIPRGQGTMPLHGTTEATIKLTRERLAQAQPDPTPTPEPEKPVEPPLPPSQKPWWVRFLEWLVNLVTR